ncbi:Flagellar motor rotation protein MotA [hydrothermal vent metagenome]|uniref:Flagellar motor rotation protein MotA n=1 Tax=hydrothermal vent metagenome TaxID=652676 RepID=A0A3B0XZH2_9ZZZZ
MDLATLIGLLGAFGIIITAIITGGSAIIFVNIPSLLIVGGGTLFAVLMKFPMGHFFGAFKVAMKAFFSKPESPAKLIEEGVSLANIARKEGVLGLEGQDIGNEFLQRGIQLCVDGHEPDFVRTMLGKDINLTIERHERGQAIFKAIGDMAPAMGMIGTLIGLVQMLSAMDDPKSIGPAMAVALLTTLYGAVIANAFALPIADKLAHRSQEERLNKSLILETISSIQEGLNPRVMEELLKTYLPASQRDAVGEAQADAA